MSRWQQACAALAAALIVGRLAMDARGAVCQREGSTVLTLALLLHVAINIGFALPWITSPIKRRSKPA
jgi:hypothetical protein